MTIKQMLLSIFIFGTFSNISSIPSKHFQMGDCGGLTPLHHGAKEGNAKTIKDLLNADPNTDINAKDSRGDTALHFAAGYGNLEAMEELLNAGANIDAKGSDDDTPLHYAARYGNLKEVEALLNAGANINAINSYHNTALHYAIIGKKEKEHLKEYTQDDHIKLINTLIKWGVNIDATNFYYQTAALVAASDCDISTVYFIYKNNGDINLEGKNGTPLDYALHNCKDRKNSHAINFLKYKTMKSKHKTMKKDFDSKYYKKLQKIKSCKTVLNQR